MAVILAPWGEDKTCKSTLALTAPKPLVYMEFDIGGFARAVNNDTRYGFAKMVKEGLIVYEAYPMPISAIGDIDISKSTITPSKRITGMKELFYKFLGNYIKHLRDSKITSIAIDTATILKQVTDDGYLQEKQEAQFDSKGNFIKANDRLREQLMQIEYKEPNTRTRGIYYNAKAANKNLILVHHARDQYKPITHMVRGELVTENLPTGNRERAGFNTLGDRADIIVHTYVERQPQLGENGKPLLNGGKPVTKPVPYCEIELCEVLELTGIRFEEPTYDKLQAAIRMVRGEV